MPKGSQLSASDSLRRQQAQWALSCPKISHTNTRLLCNSVAKLTATDPFHAFVVMQPFASANMLKSHVLVGPEQEEINSVILLFFSLPSTKKTPVLKLVNGAWQDGEDGIASDGGAVTIGGFLKMMQNLSIVPGCGIYKSVNVWIWNN
jgi:hypothetical protein